MSRAAILHEARVARSRLAAGEALKLRVHGGRIGLEIERRAVFEEAAPLRVEARQRDVVVKRAAGFREDAPQHVGQRDDRRAHVEAKPLLLEHDGFAADEVVGLE